MASFSALEAQSSFHYDNIAPDYDEMIEAYQATRECFWQCAEAQLSSAARILDFGAGSGRDTEHFATLGHAVTAYEPSQGMIGLLRGRCADQIALGTVTPVTGPLEEAHAALAARAPFDVVLCNFAVLSTIPQLNRLLRLFGQLTHPGGVVLISIQNPWYPPDMRQVFFWKALLAMPFRGVMSNASAELGRTYRYTPSRIRRAARPDFVPDSGPAPKCHAVHFGWRSPFNLVVLRRA